MGGGDMMEDNTESDITIPILFPIFQQPKIILPPPPSATDLFLYLSSSSPRQANSTPATTTPYTTTRSTNIFPQSKKAGNGTSVTDLFSYLPSSSLGLANSAPATTTPYTATGSISSCRVIPSPILLAKVISSEGWKTNIRGKKEDQTTPEGWKDSTQP